MKVKRNALTPDRIQDIFRISRIMMAKFQNNPIEGYNDFIDE
jgi:hypothetical protein